MCCEGDIHLEIVVPNQTRYLSLIGNIAEEVVKALDHFCGDREALAYHLNLVLTEAMANAIKHSGPTTFPTPVRVCIVIEDKALRIKVYDQGKGFDLDAVPEPDFDQLSECGRGIFLIRSLMDGVVYRKTDRGNVLEMHKNLA